MLHKGIRPGIIGIRKFMSETAYQIGWHIFTRPTEEAGNEYTYTTWYGNPAKQAIEEYADMGWTFDGPHGNALYFTENGMHYARPAGGS